MRLVLDWLANPDHVALSLADTGCELVEPTDPEEPLRAHVLDGDDAHVRRLPPGRRAA